ncbi:MAG: hypothetical protein DWQ01_12705 [Planctomycetota bacterium]|nr:MAG: hypothetical protein DWQ01_12705 [Planctomycetota bacterium]
MFLNANSEFVTKFSLLLFALVGLHGGSCGGEVEAAEEPQFETTLLEIGEAWSGTVQSLEYSFSLPASTSPWILQKAEQLCGCSQFAVWLEGEPWLLGEARFGPAQGKLTARVHWDIHESGLLRRSLVKVAMGTSEAECVTWELKVKGHLKSFFRIQSPEENPWQNLRLPWTAEQASERTLDFEIEGAEAFQILPADLSFPLSKADWRPQEPSHRKKLRLSLLPQQDPGRYQGTVSLKTDAGPSIQLPYQAEFVEDLEIFPSRELRFLGVEQLKTVTILSHDPVLTLGSITYQVEAKGPFQVQPREKDSRKAIFEVRCRPETKPGQYRDRLVFQIQVGGTMHSRSLELRALVKR